MNNEYEDLGSKIPDFGSVLVKRITDNKTNGNNNNSNMLPPVGTVDPYQLMLKQKRKMESGNIDPESVVKWPEEAVKQLEDYCKKMGIYGFKSALHPLVALSQLKKQYGEDYTGVPLNERVPAGYEPLGTPSYGPNNTYSEVMKKQILHG